VAFRRKRNGRTKDPARVEQERLRIIVALQTGMRDGELSQLQWQDIELGAARMLLPDYDDPNRFQATAHDASQHAAQIAHRGVHGVLNPALARSEIALLKRTGTLVRFGVRWACDFPYYEIGHNATGGQSCSLNVREDDDDDWQVVARGDSWEALFLAVERAARDGQWWSREPGARQRVYDAVYARRLSVRDDTRDAHDVALGAADYPHLDFIDYFLPWVKVAPDEVRNNAAAMKLIAFMEEEIPGLVDGLFPASTN
jgi:hypothetical protein